MAVSSVYPPPLLLLNLSSVGNILHTDRTFVSKILPFMRVFYPERSRTSNGAKSRARQGIQGVQSRRLLGPTGELGFRVAKHRLCFAH